MAEIKDYVNKAVDAILEKKGYDVKILNIEGLSPIADYFIIATGSNPNQLHAICDEISETLSKEGLHPKQTEGYQLANWILVDYGDFIIHLFQPESRDYYNLERIWKDAKTESVE
ncbi:MAG: ribosome silencing factor [Lachnospiraceae bacterium]|nr:ribosome silencing factor [Lachnospiraceae bacterium]